MADAGIRSYDVAELVSFVERPDGSMSVEPREPMFPPGCLCPSYGHGLTMTRVNAPHCPVHGATS